MSSCASVFSGDKDDIIIRTYPNNAEINVYLIDKNNSNKPVIVKNSISPNKIQLSTGKNFYKSYDYIVEIKKSGYKTAYALVRKNYSNWFTLGNLISFGVYSPLAMAADIYTDSHLKLTPNELDLFLIPQ